MRSSDFNAAAFASLLHSIAGDGGVVIKQTFGKFETRVAIFALSIFVSVLGDGG